MTSTKSIANEAELHDLITSVSNAELTLNTVVAVRDRMISAYQDIIKMAI
jgi:flagellar hook-basal body complex protein FliE